MIISTTKRESERARSIVPVPVRNMATIKRRPSGISISCSTHKSVFSCASAIPGSVVFVWARTKVDANKMNSINTPIFFIYGVYYREI